MDLTELAAIAARELTLHGLRGWTFALARTKRRLGACKYRTKRIEVSEFHARNNPDEVVLDTLRHEIAHAIAGPAAGHGPAWKAVALRVGATPRACDTSPETAVPPGDWQAACPACGKTYHRYRRPMAGGVYRCRCAARSTLTFAYAGDPARRPPPPPARPAARWEATCAGCGVVHLRVRKPREGVYRCRCPHGSPLTWRSRADGPDRSPGAR